MNTTKQSLEVAQTLRVGAGGSWRVFNEVLDSHVIKQQSEVSCGPACGEMLFRDRGIQLAQNMIEQATGAPVSVENLARWLQKLDPSNAWHWQGGYIKISNASREQVIKVLNSTGTWAAMMHEKGASISHLVIIDGLDDYGRVKVRDPYQGTSYTMDMQEFIYYWNGNGIYSSPKS